MSENKETTTKKDVEEKDEKTKTAGKTSKKETVPVNSTRFIGFSRHTSGGPWTLLDSMLSSAESVKHKIKLFKGECDVFVVEVDLPD